MILLLDIGNSRIKYASLVGDQLEANNAFAYREETLENLLDEHFRVITQPTSVYVANVAGPNIATIVSTVTRSLWKLDAKFIACQHQSHGVTNAYTDINELGVDRWMLILAAWERYHAPGCIVACGTATTIDVISGSGMHQGGFIIPGLKMMQNTLAQNTADINIKDETVLSMELGTSTSTCIVNGSGFASISMINAIVDKLEHQYGGKLRCIITGGNAESLIPYLDTRFEHVPDLVLQGMVLQVEH